MTVEEKKIMEQHAAFWRDLMDKGHCIVYGPVFEEEITYGIGIVRFSEKNIAREILSKDPSIKEGVIKIDIYQMLAITQ
jgi:hypothetical protein